MPEKSHWPFSTVSMGEVLTDRAMHRGRKAKRPVRQILRRYASACGTTVS